MSRRACVLRPEEREALLEHVRAGRAGAVARQLGTSRNTIVQAAEGGRVFRSTASAVRVFLGTPEPSAPALRSRRSPAEDVHEATGGRCRAASRSCEQACRYRLETDELATRCALDVADTGPVKLATVGLGLGVTRQRAQQIVKRATEHFWQQAEAMGIADDLREGMLVAEGHDVPDAPAEGVEEIRRRLVEIEAAQKGRNDAA